jgi:hypothetical protein
MDAPPPPPPPSYTVSEGDPPPYKRRADEIESDLCFAYCFATYVCLCVVFMCAMGLLIGWLLYCMIFS